MKACGPDFKVGQNLRKEGTGATEGESTSNEATGLNHMALRKVDRLVEEVGKNSLRDILTTKQLLHQLYNLIEGHHTMSLVTNFYILCIIWNYTESPFKGIYLNTFEMELVL